MVNLNEGEVGSNIMDSKQTDYLLTGCHSVGDSQTLSGLLGGIISLRESRVFFGLMNTY